MPEAWKFICVLVRLISIGLRFVMVTREGLCVTLQNKHCLALAGCALLGQQAYGYALVCGRFRDIILIQPQRIKIHFEFCVFEKSFWMISEQKESVMWSTKMRQNQFQVQFFWSALNVRQSLSSAWLSPPISSLWSETWAGWWPRTSEQSVRKEITTEGRLSKRIWEINNHVHTCDAHIFIWWASWACSL